LLIQRTVLLTTEIGSEICIRFPRQAGDFIFRRIKSTNESLR